MKPSSLSTGTKYIWITPEEEAEPGIDAVTLRFLRRSEIDAEEVFWFETACLLTGVIEISLDEASIETFVFELKEAALKIAEYLEP